MEPFKKVNSIITPLDKVNVDTDQIVPKQFLKLIHKSGFGKFLFYNWRYDENEKIKSDFILNDSKYDNSKIPFLKQLLKKISAKEGAMITEKP